MGTLTVQPASFAGLNYTLAAASVADVFTNDGRTVLMFVNGSVTARTLTVLANDTSKSGYGDIDVPNTVFTIPGSATNGGRAVLGLFPTARFNNVAGQVSYTLDDATNMTVAAVSLRS